MDKLSKTKQLLDSVSPTMCLAKWQQVTVHLQNGHTHSCHHPQTHKVPLEELQSNPSALHNTNYKKQQRKLMLAGQRPKECDYCWKVEDTAGNHYSDRIKKSSNSTWALPYFEQVTTQPWDTDTVPAQIEVSFGNVCNMKCVYCSPVFSSEWWSEIKQHGAYPTSDQYNNLEWIADTDRTPYLNREHNPYVEAWWKWWPEVRNQLKVIRVTGGEPLLNKNLFKLLDDLKQNPQPDLRLEINTNLAVSSVILNRTLIAVKRLRENNCVKEVMLYTSCDCHGEQAEYIREGLVYKDWLNACLKVLKNGISLHIMVTANMLSIDSMKQFMTDVYALKQRYSTITYGVSILHSPAFLNVLNLPKTTEWIDKFDDIVDYVAQQPTTQPNELNYVQRLRNYFVDNELDDKDYVKHRLDAVKFIQEINRRRNKNFSNTFVNYKFLQNI